MPQSLASVLVHLVFSTKNREPWITEAIELELHKYLSAVLRECDSPALLVDGYNDHVHALFSLSRKWTIANIVEEVKTNSSKWIKTKGEEFQRFHWQSGYGAFSVSQSNVGEVKAYIANQKEWPVSQGVALSYYILPLWGFEFRCF
ncbi:MAG: IS200/IS605 family transposase [Acidobacteria bacterium]|nr:IS200/IS605 family transposase [Acidobacteriota bacterium]